MLLGQQSANCRMEFVIHCFFSFIFKTPNQVCFLVNFMFATCLLFRVILVVSLWGYLSERDCFPLKSNYTSLFFCPSGNEFIVQWSNVFLHDNPEGNN